MRLCCPERRLQPAVTSKLLSQPATSNWHYARSVCPQARASHADKPQVGAGTSRRPLTALAAAGPSLYLCPYSISVVTSVTLPRHILLTTLASVATGSRQARCLDASASCLSIDGCMNAQQPDIAWRLRIHDAWACKSRCYCHCHCPSSLTRLYPVG